MDEPTVSEISQPSASGSSLTSSISEALDAPQHAEKSKKRFPVDRVALYTTVTLLLSAMINIMVALMNGNTAGFWGALLITLAYILILVGIKVKKASYFSFYMMVQTMALLFYIFASFRLIRQASVAGWASLLTGFGVVLIIPLILAYIYLLIRKTHRIHQKKRKIRQAEMTLDQFDGITPRNF
ncbi:unnamed protein product [Bursaphelenchus xylophilus]|uniref:(pine wood nematode) hypothetical protein n=1 Tax=Bursaphelenchus xylophilus TaxID=6326 RepID=A0A1I7SCA6_BURXY|nr:unnamed protein product [Bursaphelenchus xylophilus]CAG9094465.1 unnamed protein product [Bursaphelenchus xylophilus]